MPVNFSAAQRNRLLRFLQTRKSNAVNARNIAQHMGFPLGGNQVKTRNLIRECIEHDFDLIGSTLSTPKGFFLIDRSNVLELERYLDSLENRARETNERRNALINNWTRASLPPTTKTQLPY